MITPGTILMDRDAAHPPFFLFEDGSYPNAWKSIRRGLSPRAREAELAAAGWTLFFMANAVRTTGFGFDREKAAGAALKRAIAQAVKQRCNCLEIDSVGTHSFLGIPYVSVSAHPRHIQPGAVFSGTAREKALPLEKGNQ